MHCKRRKPSDEDCVNTLEFHNILELYLHSQSKIFIKPAGYMLTGQARLIKKTWFHCTKDGRKRSVPQQMYD